MPTIDRQAASRLKRILDRHMSEFNQNNPEYHAKIGRGRFGDSFVHFKIEVSVKDEQTGMAMTKEASDFDKLKHLHGLRGVDLGARFRANDNLYEIIGLKSRATRRPILARRISSGRAFGRLYVFPAATVVRTLIDKPDQPEQKEPEKPPERKEAKRRKITLRERPEEKKKFKIKRK